VQAHGADFDQIARVIARRALRDEAALAMTVGISELTVQPDRKLL
jgi:hypothetical protein